MNGRNKRLQNEWRMLEQGLDGRKDISCRVLTTNADGLPTDYCIDYHIHSLCGVTNIEHLNEAGVKNEPLYADHFRMRMTLPPNYPQIDGAPILNFLTCDEEGNDLPHPWHPNIRYFGAFAGRVCINMADTYSSLLWAVQRIGAYLRYDTYHATMEPPYPEDLQVATWIRNQGEPNGWTVLK
jgi:hypothetical protein